MERPVLPRAPGDALGPTGAPRLGAYQGSLGRADFGSLAPPGLLASVRHAAREKRWQRVVIGTASHVVTVSIVDGGALAGGAVWVADRATGEVVFDRAAAGVSGLSARVGPRPGAGARASFAAPGMELLLERRSDRFQLEADLGSSLSLEVFLDAGAAAAPAPFSLVAPLPEGGVRASQATGPLPAQGSLSVRGRRHPLDGGLALLTFGAGLFPREAAWRSLGAVGRLPDGRPLALHLLEGLEAGPARQGAEGGADGGDGGDAGEGALLLGDGPTRLPPVTILADPASPTAPWRIESQDRRVDLLFQPAAAHREARELLMVSLKTTQLAGAVSGHLPAPDGGPLRLEGLAALLEDDAARW